MVLPIRPNNPNIPIPNNPFSAPLNAYVNGPYFPVVMGTGIDVGTGTKVADLNNQGVLEFSGATGDINLLAGPGIAVTEVDNDFTIDNTGVISLIAGTNIQISGSNGTYTISSTDAQTGTVTSVGTGVGLTGGPITTSGTISLDVSGVAPGSYTYPSITVDAYGRITVAANGTAPVTAITGTAPVQVTGTAPTLNVAVANSSTSAAGIVQLVDALNSTSTTEALTANQGKVLQDQISALSASSNLTFAGTIDGATGLMVSVSTEAAGLTTPFVAGQAMPAPATENEDYFTIVSVAGTMTPPGGSSTATTVGDWFLSNGTAYQFLDTGFNPPYASTTEAGIVELADNSETQTGTDNTLAVTPAGLQSKVSDSVSTASSTSIASSQAVKDAYDAATGAQTDATQALADAAAAQATADAALPLSGGTMTGIINFAAGQTVPVGSIQDGTLTQKGVVQLEDSVSSTSTTTAATPNSVKQAYDAASAAQTDATQALADAAAAGADVGDLSTLTTTDKSSAVAAINEVDANADQALSDAAAAQTTANAAIPCAAITAKGDIISGSAASTPTALTVGTDGQVLTACAACSSGLTWAAGGTAGAITDSAFTAAGDLLTATGPSSPTALSVGTDGQFLMADSSASTGLIWTPNPVAAVSTSNVSSVVEDGPVTGDSVEGGYFAGLISTTADGVPDYALIVAPKSTGQTSQKYSFDLAADTPSAVWQDQVYGYPATYTDIGGSTRHPIMHWASQLTIGGYNDWYIPARYELEILYYSLKPTTIANTTVEGANPYAVPTRPNNYPSNGPGTPAISPSQTSALLFRSPNSEAFETNKAYWSSTEYASWDIKATVKWFTDGHENQYDKNTGSNTPYARAIRRVPYANLFGGNYTLGFPDSTGFSALSIGDTITQDSTGATGVITAIDPVNNTITVGSVTGTFGTGSAIPVTNGYIPFPSADPVDGQVLSACSTCDGGVTWVATPAGPGSATPVARGIVYALTESYLTDNGNTGLGEGALNAIPTGYGNVAIGAGAGESLTTGSANTFVGEQTFVTATTSFGNTALGDAAGNTATGSCNVFLGLQAGYRATGNCNTFIGYNSVCGSGVTGDQNVAIGYGVSLPVAAGNCQLVLGFASGQNWLTGDSTKAIKPGAGIIDCAGSCGIAGQVLSSNGSNAIEWITAGGGGGSSATPTTEGILFGYADGASTFNVGLGYDALNTTATGLANLAVGYSSGCAITSGVGNVLSGAAAGCALTTGSYNVGSGFQALSGLTTGQGNIAVGNLSGSSITTENYNVVIGGNPGPTGVNNNILLADGQGTLRMQVNESGAMSPNGIDYGTAGQVLTSNGTGTNWTWETPSGGDSPVVTYNQLINVTAGTAASVIGWEPERGTSENYLRSGNVSAMLFITANNGVNGIISQAWAQILISSWQGVGLSQVIAADTTGGTFSIASVIYPAYSDTTIQFTSNTTDSPMLFNISLNWFGGFRYGPTLYGTAAT